MGDPRPAASTFHEMDTQLKVDLCIVVPAFNEQDSLPLLMQELRSVLNAADIIYHVIVVDDGSRDETRTVLKRLVNEYDNLTALILSRNFGHQAAVSIGLRHAKGNAIAVMDADLQDRPADLVLLFREWRKGVDVAYAVRRNRKEPLPLRLAYAVFYRLLALMANIEIPLDSGDFCVMDCTFVERLNQLPEKLRYVRGLRAWLGGRQVPVLVDRDLRRAGTSQYTLPRLIKLAVDGLLSFSFAPLRAVSTLGSLVSGLSFLGVLVVLSWKALGLLPSGAGVATIALAVLFLGGVQLLAIGILGEYVGRVYEEVKSRPVAVVSEFLEGGKD